MRWNVDIKTSDTFKAVHRNKSDHYETMKRCCIAFLNILAATSLSTRFNMLNCNRHPKLGTRQPNQEQTNIINSNELHGMALCLGEDIKV